MPRTFALFFVQPSYYDKDKEHDLKGCQRNIEQNYGEIIGVKSDEFNKTDKRTNSVQQRESSANGGKNRNGYEHGYRDKSAAYHIQHREDERYCVI